jgi:glutamine---fructose-6-phosphate transaminase (isomerizing)
VRKDLCVIKGEYLRDLLEQPVALENTLDGLTRSKGLEQIANRLRKGAFEKLILTGMGSSFHALHPLNLSLIDRGLTPIMMETSELVHYGQGLFDPKTLIVAVSQSGQSAEIVRLMDSNLHDSAVIAVTNTERSHLAKNATAVVLTRAGHEFSVSCKTYVSTLMALQWLSDVLRHRDLRHSRHELKHAPAAAARYLANWTNHVLLLSRRLKNINHLFLVGRGASLAAAGTGALIIKESDHFHAEGMSSAAFRHGPFEMLGRDTFVLVFAGTAKTRELNRRLAADVQQQRGLAEIVGEGISEKCFRLPKLGDAVRPILEILPVQMITLTLAAISGREAGKFERATKITTKE